MALQSISEPAQIFCRKIGLSEELALLEQAWEAEAGGLAGVARVVAIERNALIVEAASAPAMQELNLRRREMVRRVNRHFAKPFLTQLFVRIAGNG
jgi:hypothetical protein